VDGRETKLYAFVMVLGYSGSVRAFHHPAWTAATMLACHLLAFAYFGGVPWEILYDNMKTAFYCDVQGSWRAAKRLTAVAAHYGFTPKRCQVRRPRPRERSRGPSDTWRATSGRAWTGCLCVWRN
jgi:transposase